MTQRGQLGHLLALTLILLANQGPVLKRDVKAAMFVHYVPCYDTMQRCSLSNSISFEFTAEFIIYNSIIYINIIWFQQFPHLRLLPCSYLCNLHKQM